MNPIFQKICISFSQKTLMKPLFYVLTELKKSWGFKKSWNPDYRLSHKPSSARSHRHCPWDMLVFMASLTKRGTKDLEGHPLKITTVNIVDALSSASGLLMGEAGEQYSPSPHSKRSGGLDKPKNPSKRNLDPHKRRSLWRPYLQTQTSRPSNNPRTYLS